MKWRKQAVRVARDWNWRAGKQEDELIRTVLAGRGQGRGRPPRRKFALQGLEREVACVLAAGRGTTW